MLQTPLSSLPGEPENPIDLTGAAAESEASPPTRESCYIVTGDEFETNGDEAEEEFPREKVVYLTLTACGPKGEPYVGHHTACYWWNMNEPVWVMMDTFRQDFPIWGRLLEDCFVERQNSEF